MGKRLIGVGRHHIPHADSDLRHHELLADVVADFAGQRGRVVLQKQAADPVQQAVVGDAVFAAVANHVHQAGFEHLDFFAQHFGLALVQADHTLPVGAAQLQAR